MLSLFTSKFGALVDIKRGFKVFFFEIVLPEKGGGGFNYVRIFQST